MEIRLKSHLSASILLHFLFALALMWMMQHQSQTALAPAKKMTWIDLETIKTPSKEDSSKKQMVQTMPGEIVNEAPKDAFLGEKNQVVDRQTVSRDKTTMIGKTQTATQQARSQAKAQSNAQPSMTDAATSKATDLSKLGLPILPAAQQKQLARPEGRWSDQGEQLKEYVKGMNESENTLLSTREFVFYGYFHRIRERLDRAWVPILREQITGWYRGGRQLASDVEHTTKVMVVLNNKGEITRVNIVGESGNQMLDDTAVKAFNEAGPFPNPPKALIDANNEIQIPWEFILRT